MAKTEAMAAIEAMGLRVSSKFIPWSQSRNKGEAHPSLNWEVTLHKGEQAIVSTLYSAGCAHCPSYSHGDKPERRWMIAYECEHGFRALGVRWGSRPEAYGATNAKNAIEPNAIDVVHSLVMDADVLDMGGFEDWASNYGYDTDSRKAERTYQACLAIALKLRFALGDAALKTLQEAFQDY
ncbi:hypothetical protein JQ617_07930 [Bradyrhizobium sp. KB893862 SZCCT0404]|uniref:hypothetical protein n=1 Tax=Bradyrhizobium sp. KB893862 SZCCT0404 TaxID=2807672 RepID=UPI001BAA202A|nr:hypothetical protein [Bradyrhizobium sp. KB893862 SZCCT0404]MBR1173879.1 hypothetical protein [Bradyrhizobium sp. KB893862 SZCCT0404]